MDVLPLSESFHNWGTRNQRTRGSIKKAASQSREPTTGEREQTMEVKQRREREREEPLICISATRIKNEL